MDNPCFKLHTLWVIWIRIIKFTKKFFCGDANVTVAQLAANRASSKEHNRVDTMNNRVWTDEEKRQIVCTNLEERKKGINFMKRIKDQQGAEFPEDELKIPRKEEQLKI